VFVVWSGLAESQRTALDVRFPAAASSPVEPTRDSPLNDGVKTRVCDFVRRESSFALRDAATDITSFPVGIFRRARGATIIIDRRRSDLHD
jgi:hypothetical protein